MGNLVGSMGERRTRGRRLHEIPCLDDHGEMDRRQLRQLHLLAVGSALTHRDDLDQALKVPNIIDIRGDEPRAVRMGRCSNHEIKAACRGLSPRAMGRCR